MSAWFDDFPSLYAFERDARRERDGLERHEHASPRRLVYELQVDVPGYDILREVRIEFPASGLEPSVFADGPKDSPHRYDDGSLCMYHPRDPEALRCVPTDGLASLIDVVRTHLFQEEEHRHGLPWPGDEAPHTMTPRRRR